MFHFPCGKAALNGAPLRLIMTMVQGWDYESQSEGRFSKFEEPLAQRGRGLELTGDSQTPHHTPGRKQDFQLQKSSPN